MYHNDEFLFFCKLNIIMYLSEDLKNACIHEKVPFQGPSFFHACRSVKVQLETSADYCRLRMSKPKLRCRATFLHTEMCFVKTTCDIVSKIMKIYA